MKTEQIMSRDFAGQPVRQFLQTQFFCATDITEIYNEIRVAEGKGKKELKHYFQNKESVEFMNELCKELNLQGKSKGGDSSLWSPADLKVVKRGKDNKGTWMHPYLFVDYAMWLNPKFRAKVVIWITDNLLGFRHAGGDAFTETNTLLNAKFNMKGWEYAKVSKLVARKVFGTEDKDQWNSATPDQLKKREKLLAKIQGAIEYGSFRSLDHLVESLEAI